MGTESSFYLLSDGKDIDDVDLDLSACGPTVLVRLFRDEEVHNYKWYNYLNDLKLLSMQYKDEIFIVERHMETGEFYKSWIRNGKEVTVQGSISYPEPDLSLVGIKGGKHE